MHVRRDGVTTQDDGPQSAVVIPESCKLVPSKRDDLYRYPAYYPSLNLDLVWWITDANAAMRWLVEPLLVQPISELHLLELFFAASFRRWQEEIHDWQTLVGRSITYFLQRTRGFDTPGHPQSEAYGQALAHLAQFPELSDLEARAQELGTVDPAPEGKLSVCPAGTLFLPWESDGATALRFTAVVRLPARRAETQKAGPTYHVTLAPETTESEAALILLHLHHATVAETTTPTRYGEFQWARAVLETIREGLAQRGRNRHWLPEVAWKAARRSTSDRFPYSDHGTTQVELRPVESALTADMNDLRKLYGQSIIDLILSFFYNHKRWYFSPVFMEHERKRAVLRALAGTHIEHRPNGPEELRAKLLVNDASLPEELRAQHVEEPFHALADEHAGQWVALLPTQIADGLAVTAGRVLFEAESREMVVERIEQIKNDHPQLQVPPYPYFAGPSHPGGARGSG